MGHHISRRPFRKIFIPLRNQDKVTNVAIRQCIIEGIGGLAARLEAEHARDDHNRRAYEKELGLGLFNAISETEVIPEDIKVVAPSPLARRRGYAVLALASYARARQLLSALYKMHEKLHCDDSFYAATGAAPAAASDSGAIESKLDEGAGAGGGAGGGAGAGAGAGAGGGQQRVLLFRSRDVRWYIETPEIWMSDIDRDIEKPNLVNALNQFGPLSADNVHMVRRVSPWGHVSQAARVVMRNRRDASILAWEMAMENFVWGRYPDGLAKRHRDIPPAHFCPVQVSLFPGGRPEDAAEDTAQGTSGLIFADDGVGHEDPGASAGGGGGGGGGGSGGLESSCAALMHFAQPGTLEYEMAAEWRDLEKRQDLERAVLRERQERGAEVGAGFGGTSASSASGSAAAVVHNRIDTRQKIRTLVVAMFEKKKLHEDLLRKVTGEGRR
eukprot:g3624.t1